MATRGRKPWTPTPENLETIARLYGKGLHERTIAGAVGVSHQTFSSKKNDYPEIAEALNRGLQIRAGISEELADKIIDDARNGSKGMACFWLKSQEGWSEDGPEKIAREVHSRLEQQREQVERDIGTKLRADADRQFSNMLEQFYSRCKKELSEDEFDRIVDLFPTSATWFTSRETGERETSADAPEAEQP